MNFNGSSMKSNDIQWIPIAFQRIAMNLNGMSMSFNEFTQHRPFPNSLYKNVQTPDQPPHWRHINNIIYNIYFVQYIIQYILSIQCVGQSSRSWRESRGLLGLLDRPAWRLDRPAWPPGRLLGLFRWIPGATWLKICLKSANSGKKGGNLQKKCKIYDF